MSRRGRVGVVFLGLCTANVAWAQEPESDLDALAEQEAALGHFVEAAESYERFADRSPDLAHGAPALHNAYLLRLGLGHAQAAGADLDALERIYEQAGARQSLSDLFWTRRDLLETSAQRRAHAVEYLDDYAGAGPRAREVIAEVVIAQIDWRASCREPLLLDSCISVSRVESPVPKTRGKYRPPKRCGDSTTTTITVHPRDRKLADAAQQRFERALRLARKIVDEVDETDVAGNAEFTRAWAAAQFYRADRHYEELLRLTLPDKLEFPVIEQWRRDSGIPDWERTYAEQVRTYDRSAVRLGEFLGLAAALDDELAKGYREVLKIADPDWTSAAGYRFGAAKQSLVEQLVHAKIPASLHSEADVGAYCEALTRAAAPLAEQARGGWLYCIERSTFASHFNEYSWACEAELERLYPDAAPGNRELFGEGRYLGPAVKSAGLVADPTPYMN